MERPGDSEPSKGRARYAPESKKRRGKPFHNAGASRSSVAISGAAARGNAAAGAGVVAIVAPRPLRKQRAAGRRAPLVEVALPPYNSQAGFRFRRGNGDDRGGARRLVGGLGVEEDAALVAGGRARGVHAPQHPPRRAGGPFPPPHTPP